MKEARWLACPKVSELFDFLEGKVSSRKLRLFGCACCRLWWELITDATARSAVEVAERYADGAATRKELAAARAAATVRRGYPKPAGEWAMNAAAFVTGYRPRSAAFSAYSCSLEAAVATGGTHDAERPFFADLLRHIVGNPFHPVTVEGRWLAWNDGTIPRLAQAIYDERRFADLPVLADALEEAGCADAPLLGHCRDAGPHRRGCWALDLLLGLS
jgi:hypothetical protein